MLGISKKIRKKIPPLYFDEYEERESVLIKNRIKLLCVLSVALYLLATLISFLIFPASLDPREIYALAAFGIGALIVLALSKRARSIGTAKALALLLAVFILAEVTKVKMIYLDHAAFNYEMYLFVLFLISFTIPWAPEEIIFVSLIDMTAYASFFLYLRSHMPPDVEGPFDLKLFMEGFVTIIMGSILCLVLRKKESERDVENFVLFKEAEERNEQVKRELFLASKIHGTLIPRSMTTDFAEIDVTYLPVEYMGGDYAEFHLRDKDKLLVFICDVTGHGVPAALLVNRLQTEFEKYAFKGLEPAPLLEKMNDFLLSDFEEANMYLSAFCCLLDFRNMMLTYSNCGHPAQYVYSSKEPAIKRLDSMSGLLGISFGEKDIIQLTETVGKGDNVYLFTDGVLETKNSEDREYGERRLEDFIRTKHALDAKSFNKQLVDDLNSFKRGKFEDDIFLLTIHIK